MAAAAVEWALRNGMEWNGMEWSVAQCAVEWSVAQCAAECTVAAALDRVSRRTGCPLPPSLVLRNAMRRNALYRTGRRAAARRTGGLPWCGVINGMQCRAMYRTARAWPSF